MRECNSCHHVLPPHDFPPRAAKCRPCKAAVDKGRKRDGPVVFGPKHMRHGHAINGKETRVYLMWKGMRKRCHLTSDKDYPNYGGRGIAVCDRWLVFDNFLADMGEPPAGKSIDRKNNNGNYEPGNCKWSTPQEQSWNRRVVKMIDFGGQSKPVQSWERELGFGPGTLRLRLLKGMSVDAAFSTPPRKRP